MYTDFYGFSDEPFALNPDPRFFFLTPHYSQVLTAMVHGIAHRREVILLTGEKGTGKTAFVQQLLQSLDPNIQAISVFNPSESFDHLLKVILRRLRLPLGENTRKGMLQKFKEKVDLERRIRLLSTSDWEGKKPRAFHEIPADVPGWQVRQLKYLRMSPNSIWKFGGEEIILPSDRRMVVGWVF